MNDILDEEEESILQDFILETEEHLDTIEEITIKIEKDGGDDASINTLFRAFHTIKGNSKWLNLTAIAEVSHEIESLLGDLRNHKIKLSSAMIDIVLEVKDYLSQQVVCLKEGEDTEEKIKELVARISKERAEH